MSFGLRTIHNGDWDGVRQNFQKLNSSLGFGPSSSPTFAGLTLTGLTANSLIYPNSSSVLTSLGAATNGQIPIGSTGATPVLAGITGTSNQVTVTNDAGSITLSTPQDTDTGCNFTCGNLTASGTENIGIDLSSGTWANADINLAANPVIQANGTQQLKIDDTNFNFLLGLNSFQNDNGQYNVGLGYQTGFQNNASGGGQEGKYNIYIGYRAGYGSAASSGYNNVAIGSSALLSITSGNQNFALGANALAGITTSGECIAIGFNSLGNMTSGNNNTLVGSSSGANIVTGSQTVAIGYQAGRSAGSATNNFNVWIGSQSGLSVTNASYNTCIGQQAGRSITTGSFNLMIGRRAGYNQTTNSNLLIIDNQNRGDAASEATTSLIYGLFDASAANQYVKINGDLYLSADNRKIFLGTGNDASIYYNGTNLVVDTRIVGTGGFTIGSGEANVDYDLIFNGETNDCTITWMEDEARLDVDSLTNFESGLRTKYSENNVADPPTDAELDNAFGTPVALGAGFVGILDDNSADTDCYICWTNDSSWWYLKGTKAV